MTRLFSGLSVAALAATLIAAALPQSAEAAYPTNSCVSAKQKAAGKYCQSVVKAWSKYHKNPDGDPGGVDRDDSIAGAAAKLASSWEKAESKAAKKDTECVDTTIDAPSLDADIANAVDNLQNLVTFALDPGNSDDRKCASKILNSAAKFCSGLLKAESKFIKDPKKDSEESKLNEDKSEAEAKFQAGYDKAAPGCAGPPPVSATMIASLTTISADAVFDTTTSPNLPTGFQFVNYPVGTVVNYENDELRPSCLQNTDWSFHYKRGTVNKLVMYYQGGGACWSGTTCYNIPTYKQTAGAGDDPSLIGTGLADFDDPDNPTKDWHFVFVSYCTGDVHWGNNYHFYGSGKTASHVGRVNARVAEKFAREHFLNPEQIIVTGSSAGSYGAWLNSANLMENIYPTSEFNVVGDAGIGVITREWLNLSFPHWGVQNELPTFIPALDKSATELSMADLMSEISLFYPQHRFASYQSAYDGSGGGQSAFYNVMKNPTNPLVWGDWWTETCEWNACMRQFNDDTYNKVSAVTDNFRYYTGAGSRHTVYGSDKIYEDTTGGTPTLVDWLTAMVDGDLVNWVNTECGDGIGEEGVGPGCDLVDTCQDGDNEGLPCTSDVDCLVGGTCEFDPDAGAGKAPYNGDGTVDCHTSPVTCPCSVGGGPGVVCISDP